MSRAGDPIATAFAVKRNTALLREARSVLRRLDKLIADAAGSETSTTHLLSEASAGVERVVHHLARQDHLLQRQAKEALSRGR